MSLDSSKPNPIAAHAMKDLAQRLNVALDDVELVEFAAVVWPDASMGCPQPGMEYRQVQVDGAFILLRADGRIYEYHSGGVRPPFLCENPAPIPAVPQGPNENN